MKIDLTGKVALVTGSTRGIGREIAARLAEAGARVAVSGRSAENAAEIANAVGGEAHGFACDIADTASAAALVDAVEKHFGACDILVNNAGIAHVGTLETTDEDTFERLYRVNVRSVFLCSKVVAPAMAARGGGVILNMASTASLIGIEDRFAYSMTKGAVLSMTRSIAVDFMSRKVRCNCICPARIHTPFVDGFLAQSYPGREAEMFEKLSRAQPIGRMGTASEVAVMALYLCSDESAFITGQALPLDGGVLVK